ncbi:helix-turn-helix domain-containing protein [Rahnella sp. ChDrAdgB13]|uniref:helix-turn-helix domain-containing protein n=1 Tax=Rahnella sp. ChDrAdgB13 TaxID=1850581 RepID=UPI001AD88C19|nr:helix-turn-helix domain-containing protein [Rahnella sp. ChDrAdgB13]
MSTLSNVVTVSDAAKMLSLSPQQIRNFCKNGKLAAYQSGKTWLIDKKSIFDILSMNNDRVGMLKNNELRALSFFSGAMGLDLGGLC